MKQKMFQQEIVYVVYDINFEEINYFMKHKLFQDSLIKVYI